LASGRAAKRRSAQSARQPTVKSSIGVSLGLARLPAILASAACVALIYVFVRPFAGRTEAAVAAVGFGLCPLFADVAKMVRFYGFHTLLFVLAAFAVYWASAIATRLPQRALGFALAAACLLGALYFQRTTLIGMVGLGLWAGGCLALEALGPTRRLLAAAGLALLALAAALLIAHASGILSNALEVYRGTAPWAAERADYEGFYLDRLLAYYPVVLPLFPLAALYAFARWPALKYFNGVRTTFASSNPKPGSHFAARSPSPRASSQSSGHNVL